MNKPKNISSKDWTLLKEKHSNLEPIVKKINEGYPIQYLIGNVNFYGYDFLVNKNVLIPRFETEGLIEKTLEWINKLELKESSVLEVGTGSGCISITLKNEIPKLEITSIDISRKALRVAKKNARINNVKVNFIHKNLFKFNLINKYDIIISNPPYISPGSKVDPKIKYEPSIAIYVEDDPLKYYKKIFDIALDHLNSKGLIALEIDEDEGKNLKKLAKQYFKKSHIYLEKDLTNKDRYLFIIID